MLHRSRTLRTTVLVAACALLATSCVWVVPVGSTHDVSEFNDQTSYSYDWAVPMLVGDATLLFVRIGSGFEAFEGEASSHYRGYELQDLDGNVLVSFAAQLATISSDGGRIAYAKRRSGSSTQDVYLLDVATDTHTLISEGFDGSAADGSSTEPYISGDGSVIVFRSGATNLLATPGTAIDDIYRHEIATGTTTLVSVGIGGAAADDDSRTPLLSADGSVLAFSSDATNLVAGDGNAARDVFVAAGGTITKRSNASGGGDADGHSWASQVSGDGSVVIIASTAENLSPEDTAAGTHYDVFAVGDDGVAHLISKDADGDQMTGVGVPSGNAVSHDGSLVLLVDPEYDTFNVSPRYRAWIYDAASDASTDVTTTADGVALTFAEMSSIPQSLSDDGRYLLTGSLEVHWIDPASGSHSSTLSTQLRIAHDVHVDDISPAVLPAGESTAVTITGSGFVAGATVATSVADHAPNGVTFSAVTVVDRSTITAVATVDGGMTGPRTIWVDTPHTSALESGPAAFGFCECVDLVD